MTPQPLNRPFVGFSLAIEDYRKVEGMLPTPSYQSPLYSYNDEKTTLVYAIESFHGSSKEYKFLSDIKLGIQKYLFCPAWFIDEYCIDEYTEINSVIYSLSELSRAFNCSYITYPKILFPHCKKELYQYLIWHGKKLRYQRLFTKEAMIATALIMNKQLPDKTLYKEAYKKALAAYQYILDHQENFKEKLTKVNIQKAHSRGGKIRKQNQARQTKERIDNLLQDQTYIKPNGKPNKTALAKALNLHRRTLDKYL